MRRSIRSLVSLASAVVLSLHIASCTVQGPVRATSLLPLTGRGVELDVKEVRTLFPELPGLVRGETSRSMNFSIDGEGQFTLVHAIEREVGTIGLKSSPLDPVDATRLGLKSSDGVLVRGVVEDGPADRAGLEKGQVVLGFSGEKVAGLDALRSRVESTPPGAEVQIEVWNGKGVEVLDITLASSVRVREDKVLTRSLERLDDTARTGVTILELPGPVSHLVDGGRGSATGSLLITGLVPDSPAFRADLRPGDRIVEVDGVRIETLEDYRRATSTASTEERLVLGLRRSGDSVDARVRVRSGPAASYRFNMLGLVACESRPSRSSSSLIWNIVFHHETRRNFEGGPHSYRPRTETSWGIGLDLLKYENSPEEWCFTIGWILPIRVKKG